MQSYATMSKEELQQEFENVKKIYKEYQGKGLKLDMSRGKPSPQQLDLGMEMLDVINSNSDMKAENGIDTRNYGLLDGIPETKRLMAEIMEVSSAA